MADTRNRRPEWVGTAVEYGLADHFEDSGPAHLGLDGPLGPCQCSDLPDVIELRELGCDVHLRKREAHARIQRLERRWHDLRIAKQFFADLEVAS
jgi:hypothetical protein